MDKLTVIKNIDKTRDGGSRPHASMLNKEACAAFARTYVSNSGHARDIYSFDQLGKYYGVSTDFASQAVSRAICEALIPYKTCIKIMLHSSGNQKRKAHFEGGLTSSEKKFSEMIIKDRFNAIKSLPENDPETYESLFRNFLNNDSLSLRRVESIYGLSTREVLYFVMLAAIRDMPDTSYDQFQEIILHEFIALPFYWDYAMFIKKARDEVSAERENYLELYEASKRVKNQHDTEFMKMYEEAKKILYDKVAEIISDFETEVELFRSKILG